MSLPDLTIRPFRPADQESARALVNAGLGEHFGYVDERYNPDLDDIAASYLDRGHVFVVAERAGIIVGTGALTIEDAHAGRLVRMSVAPEQRGRGIGRALVTHLVGVARERGLTLLRVETTRDWEDAKGLYRACGFTQVAEDSVSGHFVLSLVAEEERMADEMRVIRQLEVSDAERYRAVRLRALREEPDAFGSSYEEQVERPLSFFEDRIRPTERRVTLGAFDGDALVGMVTFMRESGTKDEHKGNIIGMYITPEARGKGLGRALLLAAIERARRMPGVEQIHLGVVTRNTAARALYLSVGFVVYGTEPHALKLPDGHYLDEDMMILWLTRA